jgi:hypothetical protein
MNEKAGKSRIVKDIMAKGFTARRPEKALNAAIESMKFALWCGEPACEILQPITPLRFAYRWCRHHRRIRRPSFFASEETCFRPLPASWRREDQTIGTGHRLVCAPAGFGKSVDRSGKSPLGEWDRTHRRDASLATLGPFRRAPSRLGLRYGYGVRGRQDDNRKPFPVAQGPLSRLSHSRLPARRIKMSPASAISKIHGK